MKGDRIGTVMRRGMIQLASPMEKRRRMRGMKIAWEQIRQIAPRSYTCGYCGNTVGPDRGFYSGNTPECIYLCSFCSRPTFFPDPHRADQTPGAPYGNDVANLPEDVGRLYQEARNCVTVGSHTSAVLTCRKILMNLAVAQGADQGQPFIMYVEYLASKGYVPPQGKDWIDHIRRKSNEANHEIALMAKGDAEDLISFLEMLLKFIYEFPARIPKSRP